MRRPSNPLALAVLTLLYERPMHPYEMAATLRDRRKEESIRLNYGSLYSVVRSLEKRRLITVQETVRDGRRPERTIYAITEKGALLMANWLGDLLAKPEKEFPLFETALSLVAALPPDEVVRLLEQRLARLEAHERVYRGYLDEAKRRDFPRLFMLEGEYGFALLQAELAYVRDLLTDLKQGTFAGYDLWKRWAELLGSGLSEQEMETTLRQEFPGQLPWPEKGGSDE